MIQATYRIQCDGCKTVGLGVGDTEVIEQQRKTLNRRGWRCDENGDRCPICKDAKVTK